MKYFDTIQKISITDEMIERARNFAKAVVATTNYSDATQNDRQKIEQDHFVSKVGEEATKMAFDGLNKNVSGPDYTIYIGKQKSWDHDLKVDGNGLAVKTQSKSVAKKFGLSWTFQSGGYRRDPILKQPEDWVCFVEYDEKERICNVYPPFQIKELTFKDPAIERLIPYKRVVYAKDLPGI